MKKEEISIFVREHKKGVYIGVFVIIAFIAFSIIFYNVRQVNKPVEEEQTQNHKIEFTKKQEEIKRKYDTQTEQLISVIENGKYADPYDKKSLEIKNGEIIEREKSDEERNTYVICTYEKSITKDENKILNNYKITILDSEDKYKNLTYIKVSDSENINSPIVGATLTSEDLFKKAKTYKWCGNNDSFEIKGWQENVNQFIGNDYNKLYTSVKSFCANHYPGISAVQWSGTVTINYFSNLIFLSFLTDTKNSSTINVIYNQTDKTLQVTNEKVGGEK